MISTGESGDNSIHRTGKCGSPCVKIETGSLTHHSQKSTLCVYLSDLGIGKDFLNKIRKVLAKEKIYTFDFIKIKNFHSSKDDSRKEKDQATTQRRYV